MVCHSSRVLASALLFTTLLLGSCVEDQELFIISYAVGLDTDCTVGSTRISTDTLDVSADAPIGLGLVLENLQTGNSGSNTGLSDDGEIKLEHAEVTLSLEGFSAGYEVPLASDSLPSSSSLSVFVQLPSTVTSEIRGAVAPGSVQIMTMSVVVVGDRTGQAGKGSLGEVRTRQYDFPFQVCSGCVGCITNCGLAQASTCDPDEEEETTG
jgi:hypothetical protein